MFITKILAKMAAEHDLTAVLEGSRSSPPQRQIMINFWKHIKYRSMNNGVLRISFNYLQPKYSYLKGTADKWRYLHRITLHNRKVTG